MYGNQNHNYLNAIKAEQLMVDEQLLIGISLKAQLGHQ